MEQITVLKVLQEATDIRRALSYSSNSENCSVSNFTLQERSLNNVGRIDTIRVDNDPITQAVSRFLPSFSNTVLANQDCEVLKHKLLESYGTAEKKYIDGYLYERHEDDTHAFHKKDLEFVVRALQPIVQNMYPEIHQEQGIKLVVASERSQTEVYASKPDHRVVIKFQQLSLALSQFESDVVMESITMEDKPLRKLGEGMFLEVEDLHVDWPNMEKLVDSTADENKSRRLAVQMATQMYDKNVRHSAFYTINRIIYVRKDDNHLVRSHVVQSKAAKKINIDFVEYASWIMSALKDALDRYDVWYKQVYLVTYAEAGCKSINLSWGSVQTRFALSPSVAWTPSMFGAPFTLPPRVKVQLGKKYVQEFDAAPTVAGWLPKWLYQYLFPEIRIDCPIDLWAPNGCKVVSLNLALGIAVKITTSPAEDFRREVLMTVKASRILPCNTPKIFAVYGGQPGMILLSYTGTSFTTWTELGKNQLQEVLDLIDKLHHAQLHHHDIRPENVTVDSMGRLSIIDFETCIEVVGECKECRDEYAREEILEVLDNRQWEGGHGGEDEIDEDENGTMSNL